MSGQLTSYFFSAVKILLSTKLHKISRTGILKKKKNRQTCKTYAVYYVNFLCCFYVYITVPKTVTCLEELFDAHLLTIDLIKMNESNSK